jgi:hypothetical protein
VKARIQCNGAACCGACSERVCTVYVRACVYRVCVQCTRVRAISKSPHPPSSTVQLKLCSAGWGVGAFFLVPAAAPGSLGTSTPPQHQRRPLPLFLLSRDRCPSADCCDRGQSAQHSVHGYCSSQPTQWTAAENRSRALRYSCSNWSVTMFQPAIDPSGQGIISPDVATSVERSPSGSKMPPVRGPGLLLFQTHKSPPPGDLYFFLVCLAISTLSADLKKVRTLPCPPCPPRSALAVTSSAPGDQRAQRK